MTDKVNDGGLAFPSKLPHLLIPDDISQEVRDQMREIHTYPGGMTLRQWYKGMAVIKGPYGTNIRLNTQYAAKIADAMLEEDKDD